MSKWLPLPAQNRTKSNYRCYCAMSSSAAYSSNRNEGLTSERERELLERIAAQEDMLRTTMDYMSEVQAKLEEQKAVLEEKNREIMDSVNYAKLIQDAIMPDPKDIAGGPKFSMSLLPMAALAQLDAPFRDGAEKYGPANWRDQPVSARVYVDAAFRHMALWLAGQETTSDTGICHLAAAASNLLILLDARSHWTMKDDRVKFDNPDVLEEIFQEIKERNG